MPHLQPIPSVQHSSAVFISDLHLSEYTPKVLHAFERFLLDEAPHYESLFILGDLFDAWIGDDYSHPFLDVMAQRLNHHSREHAIYFVRGNRDYTAAQNFADRFALTILPDPSCIEIADEKILISHGDSFCTLDLPYLQWKKTRHIFSRELQEKPEKERLQLVHTLRQNFAKSQAEKAEHTTNIVDVTPAAIIRTLRGWNITKLIHGHTHRPKLHHEYDAAGNYVGDRYVLGDWTQSGGQIVTIQKPDRKKQARQKQALAENNASGATAISLTSFAIAG